MSTSPIARTTVTNVLPGTEQGQTLRWDTGAVQWQATSDLIVADTGNVGIGTTAPTHNLEIEGASARMRIQDTGSNGTYATTILDNSNSLLLLERPGANQSSAELKATGNIATLSLGSLSGTPSVITGTGQNLAFTTSGTERMRLDASGNLLVGTTTQGGSFSERMDVFNAGTVASFRTSAGPSTNPVVNFYSSTSTRVSTVTRDGAYLDLVAGVNYSESLQAVAAQLQSVEAYITALQAEITNLGGTPPVAPSAWGGLV